LSIAFFPKEIPFGKDEFSSQLARIDLKDGEILGDQMKGHGLIVVTPSQIKSRKNRTIFLLFGSKESYHVLLL